jgi:hypothetical protein
MKRSSTILAALCATAALVACGTEPVASGSYWTGTGADATTDGAAVDAAKDTTASDAPGATSDAKDAAEAPKDASTTTGADATADVPPKAKPCDGKCVAGEFCDAANNCVKVACTLPTTFGTAKAKGDPQNVQKLSVLKIAGKDKDGVARGCDLNGDGKVDNALGGLASLANGQLEGAMKKGQFVLILEPLKYAQDGNQFQVNLLVGDKDDTDKDCDVTDASKTCKYTVTQSNYDLTAKSGNCPPLVVFDNAKIGKDGAFAAGGDKQTFDLKFNAAGVDIALKITQAKLSGKVTSDKAWVDTKDGLVCGVLTEKDISNLIANLPEEFKNLEGTIKAFLKPDLDTDNDGKKDAVSVALEFESIKGTITAVSTPKP